MLINIKKQSICTFTLLSSLFFSGVGMPVFSEEEEEQGSSTYFVSNYNLTDIIQIKEALQNSKLYKTVIPKRKVTFHTENVAKQRDLAGKRFMKRYQGIVKKALRELIIKKCCWFIMQLCGILIAYLTIICGNYTNIYESTGTFFSRAATYIISSAMSMLPMFFFATVAPGILLNLFSSIKELNAYIAIWGTLMQNVINDENFDIEERYMRIKHEMDKNRQLLIEEMLAELRATQFSEKHIEHQRHINYLLQMPSRWEIPKPKDYNPEKFDELFIAYKPELKQRLKRTYFFLYRTLLHVWKEARQGQNPADFIKNRIFINFFGVPGAGKTRAARLIVELLGMQYVTLSFSADPRETLGIPGKTIGLLPAALMSNGSEGIKNQVVIWIADDIDRSLNTDKVVPMTLRLLDNTKKKAEIPYPNTDIPMPLITIASTNHRINDKASANRINSGMMILFGEAPFSLEGYKMVIKEKLRLGSKIYYRREFNDEELKNGIDQIWKAAQKGKKKNPSARDLERLTHFFFIKSIKTNNK